MLPLGVKQQGADEQEPARARIVSVFPSFVIVLRLPSPVLRDSVPVIDVTFDVSPEEDDAVFQSICKYRGSEFIADSVWLNRIPGVEGMESGQKDNHGNERKAQEGDDRGDL